MMEGGWGGGAHRFVHRLALTLERLGHWKLLLVVVGVQLDGLADREEARLLRRAPTLVDHLLFYLPRICAVSDDDGVLSLHLLADEDEEGFCAGIPGG
jgi:hypothetical protein